jgi:hypothetical protein
VSSIARFTAAANGGGIGGISGGGKMAERAANSRGGISGSYASPTPRSMTPSPYTSASAAGGASASGSNSSYFGSAAKYRGGQQQQQQQQQQAPQQILYRPNRTRVVAPPAASESAFSVGGNLASGLGAGTQKGSTNAALLSMTSLGSGDLTGQGILPAAYLSA